MSRGDSLHSQVLAISLEISLAISEPGSGKGHNHHGYGLAMDMGTIGGAFWGSRILLGRRSICSTG
jgi:hypothetical protein